tara:strand:+ start:1223 stop:2374 length:1152 start_codon:yes stop_codon:yes gene_type:complete
MIINNKILLAIFVCLTISVIVTIYFISVKNCTPSCKNKKCDDDDGCGGKCNDNCEKTCPYPTIKDLKYQDPGTMKIINNTSENYLHVFFQVSTNKKGQKGYWTKQCGNGKLYEAVDWSKLDGNIGYSWDPLGAKLAQEGIIPKGGVLTVKIPPTDKDDTAFVVQAIKMTNSNSSTPLVWEDGSPSNRKGSTIKKVVEQWPVLVEGGLDMVSDASAVDGINFKMNYSLTTDNNQIHNMVINKNPCQGLDSKYKLDIGCRNPAKIDCANNSDSGWNPKDSCSCKPKTQNCAFNDCSKILFNIPADKHQYYHNYDGGKRGPNGEVVKPFINDSKNLIDGTPLKQFCEDIQFKSGNFTTYCYDYNDTSSSPYLRSPYKISVIYTDLD